MLLPTSSPVTRPFRGPALEPATRLPSNPHPNDPRHCKTTPNAPATSQHDTPERTSTNRRSIRPDSPSTSPCGTGHALALKSKLAPAGRDQQTDATMG